VGSDAEFSACGSRGFGTGQRVDFTGFTLGGSSYTPTAAAAAEAAADALEATLLAIDSHSNVVGALPVNFRRRMTMTDTATLLGTDVSGAIRVVATVNTNPPSMKLNLHYLAGSSAVPRDLLASFGSFALPTGQTALG
jgi:hypothetical protein